MLNRVHRTLPHASKYTFVLVFAMLVGLLSLVGVKSAAAAGPCGPPVTSVIACENTLQGDPPSDWQVSGAGDPMIQGFATQMSVNAGQTESFKIDTTASSYHIDILRVGYYQGDGARKVVSNMQPSAPPQNQPDCWNDTAPTGLIDCGNWALSASWTVPADAVSGLYLAHLVRDDTGGSSLIPFVVRNDASHSDILFQTDDETWQAYNSFDGNSLYTCGTNCPPGNPKAYKGAAKVSYNRPWHTAEDDSGHSWFMYTEYPMIRFMEENGYDVSYTSGVDMGQSGAASLIEQHKVFLTAGHDEYWSGQQRANVTAARDAGVNMAFFTGNEVFWKTRWEPSIDGSNTPNRTLVAYKETHYDAPTDPQNPTWTGTWMDPRFSPPGDGGNPQNALTGQLADVNASSTSSTDITVPSQYSKLRFWRNTPVATLASGKSTTLAAGSNDLGYEWDVDADNGFRPPGLMDMSSTTNANAEVFTDYGSTTQDRPATHHLTLYRAASGALVFGAGTVQWAYGLDRAAGAGNATSLTPPDPAMQQATVNLLADMGAQPATLMSGLTAASASTDRTPPTSAITSPAQGANLPDGSAVTITGTATDAGGGVVAGVEISTDSGKTWHPVTTMSAADTSVTWSYSWIAHGNPTATIKTRAVDDSGNLETPSSGTTVNVTCPCSIWGTNTQPATADSGDAASIEVGVKFTSDAAGTATGIRFYKASTNTGTHIGNLWTATGQLLASATFTNETASGWQQVNFSQPVPLAKDTTYVASYFAPNGHYSQDSSYFYTTPPMGTAPTITNVDSPPLHALRNTNGVVNGVYSAAGASTFPTGSADASNYWVDVVFSPTAGQTPPGTPTGVTATASDGSATVSWTAPASSGGSTITSYTVTPYIGSTAQTPKTVTGAPPATTATVTGLTNGTTYAFTVSATNANGTGSESSPSSTVTPTAPPTVATVTPTAGATGVAVSAAPTATFSQPVTSGTVSFTVKDPGGNNVPGSVALNGGGTVATFTPSGSLAAGTAYTATVSGAQNSSGVAMSGPFSWTFTTAQPQCPCSVWQNGTPTGAVDANDTSAVNLGLKFQASTSGFITAVRFYKEADNTGAHTGALWSSTGALLASGTFSNETASGWQELDFSSPVAITAGTTYVASYFTSTGHYALTGNGLASAVTNSPLTALASGGVYAYGSGNTFPSLTYNASNYWVDAVYSQSAGSTPPSVTTVTPSSGSTGVAVSAAPTATFSQPVVPSTVSFTLTGPGGSTVPGSVSFNGANTVATFTPTSSLAASTTYTATVSGAQNSSGVAMSSPFTWSFTTGTVSQCPCSIWQNGTPSGAVDAADTSAVNLGIQFQANSNGHITGIRFYKESDNTGTHTGTLWTASGTQLATGTFTNETASGWQELDFTTPVAITAGTTYVASYSTSTGHYADTQNGLASPVTNGPLTALAVGGVYAYGAANTFPSLTYNASNYWVDVVYSTP